jgi:hypothetical protein
LVAIGEAVDHTRLGGAPGQQRAAKRVSFDRHHDHALALPKGLQGVLDSGDRIAGGLDHDVDFRVADQGAPIVGEMGVAVPARFGERPRSRHFGLPTQPRQVFLRLGRRQIGDADKVDAGRGRDLREIHGAKLAGADQPDAQWFAVGRALQQHAMQVHRILPYSAACLRRAARSTASSSQASIGVKSR